MTETTFTLTGYEAKTRELFTNPQIDLLGWPAAAIRLVFKACWSQSMCVAHITRVACAMSSITNSDQMEPLFAKTLTKLVRLGVLRSRKSGKTTLYEVNY